LGDLSDRHESLRTIFPQSDGVAVQHILDGPAGRLPLTVVTATEDELPALVAERNADGFDLTTELPVRAWLFTTTPTDHVLLIVTHHIAVDGWSMGVLTRDLQTAYAARTRGEAPGWTPLPVQYGDYALWQREVLGDPDDEHSIVGGQLGYWKRTLAGAPPELTLPLDRPRPAAPTFRGATVPIEVGADVHAGLLQVAQQGRATMFMVVHAALSALLSRVGAGTDIPLGTAIAGRSDAALDDLLGFFINTLVLRADLSGNPTFAEILDRVRETDLAAYAHQDVPFERLVDELNPVRSLSRNPLYQISFALLNADGNDTRWRLPGLHAGPYDALPGLAARDDLSFDLVERRESDGSPAGLVGGILFATDLFD
ncbi:condensation domain-containing protein, partial [Actinoplanes sp. NPDC049548]|uniref:condensation domain-containing protein n=1 Tax=Actinoplanes sp. NPDC049548 TaxID=3155152 RepID=UPI0034427623